MVGVYFDAKFRRWCVDYGTSKRYFLSYDAACKLAYGR